VLHYALIKSGACSQQHGHSNVWSDIVDYSTTLSYS
jgi:hypothetical protein